VVKKFSHLGDVPGISAPLPSRDFKNLDLELWIVNNLIFLIFSGVGEGIEHKWNGHPNQQRNPKKLNGMVTNFGKDNISTL